MPHPSKEETHRRANQRTNLLALLRANSPDLAPLREVLEVAGFQYSARIFELRRLGHRIENEPGRGFRLIHKPALIETPPGEPNRQVSSSAEPMSLFGNLEPGPRYPD